MITVINFSHPLTDKAARYITEEYGCGDATIHEVPVQLDMTLPLRPQLVSICQTAVNLTGGNPYNIDCIVPPGHPVAAAYVARCLPTANIIVMARTGAVSQFLPVELIRPVRG